jgi:hypothetical protein
VSLNLLSPRALAIALRDRDGAPRMPTAFHRAIACLGSPAVWILAGALATFAAIVAALLSRGAS